MQLSSSPRKSSRTRFNRAACSVTVLVIALAAVILCINYVSLASSEYCFVCELHTTLDTLPLAGLDARARQGAFRRAALGLPTPITSSDVR
jgi:hypothetical protein